MTKEDVFRKAPKALLAPMQMIWEDLTLTDLERINNNPPNEDHEAAEDKYLEGIYVAFRSILLAAALNGAIIQLTSSSAMEETDIAGIMKNIDVPDEIRDKLKEAAQLTLLGGFENSALYFHHPDHLENRHDVIIQLHKLMKPINPLSVPSPLGMENLVNIAHKSNKEHAMLHSALSFLNMTPAQMDLPDDIEPVEPPSEPSEEPVTEPTVDESEASSPDPDPQSVAQEIVEREAGEASGDTSSADADPTELLLRDACRRVHAGQDTLDDLRP